MSPADSVADLTAAILQRDHGRCGMLAASLQAWCDAADRAALRPEEAERLRRNLRRLSAVVDGARSAQRRLGELRRLATGTQVYGEKGDVSRHTGGDDARVVRL
jgi:hypothetical protein